MTPVNADNPKPRVRPAEKPAPPAPAPGAGEQDGSLEDRIDSLLSEMQVSLDEIDRSSDQPAGVAPTSKRARGEDGQPGPTASAPSAQDEALAAALDEAVAQAEQALIDTPEDDAENDPAALVDEEDEADAPADELEDEAPEEVEPAAPAVAAVPDPEASIESLDEQLARRAEALPDDDDAPPAMVQREHRPRSQPTQEMIEDADEDAPGEAERAVTASGPKASREKPALKIKGKGKISVRKREGEAASAPADVEEPEPAVASAAPAPVANPKPVAAPAGIPTRTLAAIASPLKFVSPTVRDYIGWFGLLTAFNAVCVWIFWLLLRA